MFFYPKHITQEAIEALQSVGLEFQAGYGNWEMEIPNELIERQSENSFTVKGVTLEKHRLTFSGHQDAPKVYSTLEGGMVPTGVDLNQCSICGYWLDRKMSPSDERQHNQQCGPRYVWVLAASKVKV